MLSWAFFIIVLDIILALLLLQCRCLNATTIVALAGFGVAGIGIIVQTLSKIKAGTREKMAQELRQLRNENKELLQRLAENSKGGDS